MYPTNDSKHKHRRRRLRRDQTMAEKVLWQELRAGRAEYKWRRQFGIGNYIVDFCCVRLKLVIEADGPIHEGREDYDKSREYKLRKNGFEIIRFKNDEILFERDRVMDEITKVCKIRERTVC